MKTKTLNFTRYTDSAGRMAWLADDLSARFIVRTKNFNGTYYAIRKTTQSGMIFETADFPTLAEAKAHLEGEAN
jgi:hypothetical protein